MKKTEHELLKEICEEIGYEFESHIDIIDNEILINEEGFDYETETDEIFRRKVNVTEIIFNPEFIDKLRENRINSELLRTYKQTQKAIDEGDKDNYIRTDDIIMQQDYTISFGLFNNLHDPVTYLHNIIFPKK